MYTRSLATSCPGHQWQISRKGFMGFGQKVRPSDFRTCIFTGNMSRRQMYFALESSSHIVTVSCLATSSLPSLRVTDCSRLGYKLQHTAGVLRRASTPTATPAQRTVECPSLRLVEPCTCVSCWILGDLQCLLALVNERSSSELDVVTEYLARSCFDLSLTLSESCQNRAP